MSHHEVEDAQVLADFEQAAASWRPEPARVTGALEQATTDRLAALLGVPAPGHGEVLPPLWHEVLLRDAVSVEQLGADGHPADGPLLPPLSHRRRMFGGSTLETTAPLCVGDLATRTSQVADVRVRQGRSGPLLLVTEEHRWSVQGRQRLGERRELVYRRAADVGSPAATTSPEAAPSARTSVTHVPDERYLFAFSALTYNPHRIHYDATYAQGVEGHPALVVHGPLLALWCAEHARQRLGAHPRSLSYRLTSTAYVGEEVTVGSSERDGELSVEAWSRGRRCVRMTVPAATSGGA